ncbi:MAG: HDIG domain-containing protein [candidate division Zixibacteria bacterium]|nr:HDIG domain-containing protein [candidate division Zixibacteria bacterium]
MIDRPTALSVMESKITNQNLRKHILAVEAGMIRLAKHFGENAELWGLTGLLHDLDYDVTANEPDKHTFVTEQWLAEYDLPRDMLYAIRCHPGHAECKSRLDWALYTVDPATGFIVACALMHPSKKLINVDGEFMSRRFKEKRFAAGALRENMAACTNLGLELDAFLLLVHDGMMTISDVLEL